MKKSILTITVVLMAIFSLSTAFSVQSTKFDNAKWTKGPCISAYTITGMATGLGSGPYELHVTGYYDCVNKGSNTPGSEHWSELDIVIPVTSKQQGGNYKISATIPPQCDHANWTFVTKELQVTLTQNGSEIIGATDVPNCN